MLELRSQREDALEREAGRRKLLGEWQLGWRGWEARVGMLLRWMPA